MTHAKSFALWGAALAAGAPIGLAAVRVLASGEIATFAYVAIGTALAMSAFGWAIGRKEDQLELLTLTDTLTGLGNRRKFDARLGEELARTGRSGRPLSLLIIDLDRFKTVNDRYGHLAGDRVLRQVASLVEASFRKSDVVCRYGGEEIAIIAPDTTLDHAFSLAERVRELISHTPLPIPGEDVRITISVGLAETNGAARPEDLTARADEALYEAKREGRNQCRLSRLPEVTVEALLH